MSSKRSDIPELDAAGLRRFGFTMAAIIAVLFGLLFPVLFTYSWPYWPWVVGGFLILWSLIVPGSLDLVYRPWMMLGIALNRITTPIIMGAVFFLLVTPMSLIMKIIHRDPLSREFDRGAKSYRLTSTKKSRRSLERPF